MNTDDAHWRTVRALLLLLGDSGLRRAEAADAMRHGLRIVHMTSAVDADSPPVWLLTVTGKRNRQRSVPVSAACVAALRAHWKDRGLDFEAASFAVPLIGPLVIPPTSRAQRRALRSRRLPIFPLHAYDYLQPDCVRQAAAV